MLEKMSCKLFKKKIFEKFLNIDIGKEYVNRKKIVTMLKNYKI